MTTTTLRRLLWGTLGLICVGVWALALIGALALVGPSDCPAIWEPAQTARTGAR